MKEKSFLIIAASIGSGHMRAAEAVAEALKIEYPGARIEIVDFSAWQVSPATAFMKASYLFLLRFIPNLYDLMYRFTGGKTGGLSMQNLISAVTARDIRALVRRFQPDTVICTHPFPAGAVSWRKARHLGEFIFTTVITDYSVHQMWIYPNADGYFVAREAMKTELIAAGLAPESVFATGIPITECFRCPKERRAALAEIGLSEEVPTVLLMGGGLGLGGVEAALAELEKTAEPIQIMVVAGRNEALKRKAEELALQSSHRILVWGYSSQIRTLMAAASFIISKPGALTISEALAAELPMLLHDPIPGPEAQNGAYIAAQGAALWVSDPAALGEAIRRLLAEPERLGAMRERAHALKRPEAAREIARILSGMLADRSGNKQTIVGLMGENRF